MQVKLGSTQAAQLKNVFLMLHLLEGPVHGHIADRYRNKRKIKSPEPNRILTHDFQLTTGIHSNVVLQPQPKFSSLNKNLFHQQKDP